MVTLTETELATRWSMTTKTLYRWRTQNQGPNYMKLGKKILYPLASETIFLPSRKSSI